MIIRILGDESYEVADSEHGHLTELDDVLTSSLESGDESQFAAALNSLIRWVREVGDVLSHDDLRTSELVIPNEGSTAQEVRELLESEDSTPS